MVRRRFAANGETNQDQASDSSAAAVSVDRRQRDALNGYKKLAGWLLFFLAFVLIRTYVFSTAIVIGPSMEPTFWDGDVLLTRCDTSSIGRYDVVIVKLPDQSIIKRVVGLPGDTVQIRDGLVYINGREVENAYAFHTEDAGVAADGYTLDKDEYFLLGDNRRNSMDSREFGSVSGDNIRGIVTFRLLPLKSFGSVPHTQSERS